MRRGNIVAAVNTILPLPESINNCTDIMLVSPEVYTELVSLMLSGYDTILALDDFGLFG